MTEWALNFGPRRLRGHDETAVNSAERRRLSTRLSPGQGGIFGASITFRKVGILPVANSFSGLVCHILLSLSPDTV